MENDRNSVGIQVNLPNNIAILYTDATYLTVNEYGLVLDFAQRQGPTNQQTIVSRIGMSKEHARILVERLSDLLKKDILVSQKQVTQSPVKRGEVN